MKPNPGFGERILARRKEVGLTRVELGRKMNVSDDTVRAWETDKVQIWRREEQMNQLAEILRVELDYLVTGANARAAVPSDHRQLGTTYNPGQVIPLPLVMGVMGSRLDEEGCFEGEPSDVYPVPALLIVAAESEYFVARIRGSSMSPRIEHSEFALIKLNRDPPVRTLVYVQRPDRFCVIKRLALGKFPLPYQLDPVNPDYSSITDISGWDVIGSVVAIIKQAPLGEPNLEWAYDSPLRA